MSNPDDAPADLSPTEQQALVLARQIKEYRTEAAKWGLLADNCDNDAGAQIAAVYQETWESLAEKRRRQLRDLDTQLGMGVLEDDE